MKAIVLTRRLGERILIGEGISVEVTRLNRSQVRLRIDAPGIRVMRAELVEGAAVSCPRCDGTGEVWTAAGSLRRCSLCAGQRRVDHDIAEAEVALAAVVVERRTRRVMP